MRFQELHLPRDFSQEAFSGDMSGSSADISKGYFLQAYRKFESPPVRHEVIDITIEMYQRAIVPTLPKVSGRTRAS
jgi:hypothetical protein